MEYAMELAKILGREVCAIHAIGSMEGVFNNTYNALYIEDYYASKRQALATWTQTYTAKDHFSDITVSSVCEVGSLSAVVNKYIAENPIEILVMGTMGSTGITGIFGSNASAMVEKTKIPTLIIPLESKFARNPVITLATDFGSDLSGEDVVALNELAGALGAPKLEVLNVVEGPTWKTNEAGEAKLRGLLDKAELEFRYTNENSPIEGIMNFIIANNTDILCLVKRHHNIIYRLFTTSTVNKVVTRTIKAVLILHE